MSGRVQTADGRPLGLVKVLARGGEGVVWTTDRPGLLAKIYHLPASPALAAKLDALIASRPAIAPDAPPVAWPLDILRDDAGTVVGALIPRVRGQLTLHALCVPRLRQRLAPGLSWYRLFDVAIALAEAVDLVHRAGAVIGDLRADNVIVDASGPRLTLIDADSFQIAGHPCPVGSEGTTPPELMGRDFAATPRHPHHDGFGLAVLVHHLLLGVHPFSGVWHGDGEPPGLDEAIQQGFWAQATPPGPLSAPLIAPPLTALPAPLPDLFRRAFLIGHGDPAARPQPADWSAGLATARDALEPCATREGHYHPPQVPCPWCALTAVTGRDPWPEPPGGVAEPRLIDKRLLATWRRGDRAAAADLWLRYPELADDPHLPPDITSIIAADAAILPAVRQLCAMLTRPGTPSAEIAALWRRVAGTPLAAAAVVDGRPLSAHGATAEARAAALDCLEHATTSRDLAEAGIWAHALFPARHWELRAWRERLSAVSDCPVIALAGPSGVGKERLRAAVRPQLPDVGLVVVPWGWAHRPEGRALVAAADVLVLMADADAISADDAASLEALARTARRLLPVAIGANAAGAPINLPARATADQILAVIRVGLDMIGG